MTSPAGGDARDLQEPGAPAMTCENVTEARLRAGPSFSLAADMALSVAMFVVVLLASGIVRL